MSNRLISAICFALLAAFLVLAPDVEARRGCPNPWATAEHFGTYEGAPGWANGNFDLNGDGAVTVGDIILSINCWLEERP